MRGPVECPFCGVFGPVSDACANCGTSSPDGFNLADRYRVNRRGKGRMGNATPVAHSWLMRTKQGRWHSDDGTVLPLTNTDPEALR